MAIYYQDQPVVDLWGGWFDQSRRKPNDHNALQYVFFTLKGLVAIAVALCVQRGLLDYSALVKTYWPEYEKNGKENTTVADILSHRAGLTLDNYLMERILNLTLMVHTQVIIDQSVLVGRVIIPMSHGDRIRSVNFW
ncbi:unnamed protein product [Rotaria socialis]|nr:unnamed protein product [Rotaria socialis]